MNILLKIRHIMALTLCGIFLLNTGVQGYPGMSFPSRHPVSAEWKLEALTNAGIPYFRHAFSGTTRVVIALLAVSVLDAQKMATLPLKPESRSYSTNWSVANPEQVSARVQKFAAWFIATKPKGKPFDVLRVEKTGDGSFKFFYLANKNAWPMMLFKAQPAANGTLEFSIPLLDVIQIPDAIDQEKFQVRLPIGSFEFAPDSQGGYIATAHSTKGVDVNFTFPGLGLPPVKLNFFGSVSLKEALKKLYQQLPPEARARLFVLDEEDQPQLLPQWQVITPKITSVGGAGPLEQMNWPLENEDALEGQSLQIVRKIPTHLIKAPSGTYRQPGLFGALEQDILQNLDDRQDEFLADALARGKDEKLSGKTFRLVYRADLPESIRAYQFTKAGKLYIVFNRAEPLKRISSEAETFFHEIREAHWMEKGLSRNDAHIMASAEQRRAFSHNHQLTPQDIAHLSKMNIPQLESIIRETADMRSRHHTLLESFQDQVEEPGNFVADAKEYENVFYRRAQKELLARRVDELQPKIYSQAELAQALKLSKEELPTILPELNQNRTLLVWFTFIGSENVQVERLDPVIMRKRADYLRNEGHQLNLKLQSIWKYTNLLLQMVGINRIETAVKEIEKLVTAITLPDIKAHLLTSARDKAEMILDSTAAHFLNNAAMLFAYIGMVQPGTVRKSVEHMNEHIQKYIEILEALSNMQHIQMGERGKPIFENLLDVPTLLQRRAHSTSNEALKASV